MGRRLLSGCAAVLLLVPTVLLLIGVMDVGYGILQVGVQWYTAEPNAIIVIGIASAVIVALTFVAGFISPFVGKGRR